MLENISMGPMCMFSSPEDVPDISTELIKEGFIPLYTIVKGKLFDQLAKGQPSHLPPVTGIVISIRFKKHYND